MDCWIPTLCTRADTGHNQTHPHSVTCCTLHTQAHAGETDQAAVGGSLKGFDGFCHNPQCTSSRAKAKEAAKKKRKTEAEHGGARTDRRDGDLTGNGDDQDGRCVVTGSVASAVI